MSEARNSLSSLGWFESNRVMRSIDHSKKAIRLGILAALASFAITPMVPKQWRIFPVATGLLTAASSVSSGRKLLADEEKDWAEDVIVYEAAQDRLYTGLVGDDETRKVQKYTPILYDWKQLIVSEGNDQFKPRLVVGTTGDGKTTLFEYLFNEVISADYEVFTTTWQQGLFTGASRVWNGSKEVADGAEQLQTEYRRRQRLYVSNTYAPVRHYVFDEYRDLARNVKDLPEKVLDWVAQMRKLYQVLWLGVHTANVATLKFEGEGEMRRAFTIIRLGQFAIDYARELVTRGVYPPEFLAYVESMKRPVMVDDLPALIPEVTTKRPVANKQLPQNNLPVSNIKEDVPVLLDIETEDEVYLDIEETYSNKGYTRSQAIKAFSKAQGLEYNEGKEMFDYLENKYGKLVYKGTVQNNERQDKGG